MDKSKETTVIISQSEGKLIISKLEEGKFNPIDSSKMKKTAIMSSPVVDSVTECLSDSWFVPEGPTPHPNSSVEVGELMGNQWNAKYERPIIDAQLVTHGGNTFWRVKSRRDLSNQDLTTKDFRTPSDIKLSGSLADDFLDRILKVEPISSDSTTSSSSYAPSWSSRTSKLASALGLPSPSTFPSSSSDDEPVVLDTRSGKPYGLRASRSIVRSRKLGISGGPSSGNLGFSRAPMGKVDSPERTININYPSRTSTLSGGTMKSDTLRAIQEMMRQLRSADINQGPPAQEKLDEPNEIGQALLLPRDERFRAWRELRDNMVLGRTHSLRRAKEGELIHIPFNQAIAIAEAAGDEPLYLKDFLNPNSIFLLFTSITNLAMTKIAGGLKKWNDDGDWFIRLVLYTQVTCADSSKGLKSHIKKSGVTNARGRAISPFRKGHHCTGGRPMAWACSAIVKAQTILGGCSHMSFDWQTVDASELNRARDLHEQDPSDDSDIILYGAYLNERKFFFK
jgi:hypothetical protein